MFDILLVRALQSAKVEENEQRKNSDGERCQNKSAIPILPTIEVFRLNALSPLQTIHFFSLSSPIVPCAVWRHTARMLISIVCDVHFKIATECSERCLRKMSAAALKGIR